MLFEGMDLMPCLSGNKQKHTICISHTFYRCNRHLRKAADWQDHVLVHHIRGGGPLHGSRIMVGQNMWFITTGSTGIERDRGNKDLLLMADFFQPDLTSWFPLPSK